MIWLERSDCSWARQAEDTPATMQKTRREPIKADFLTVNKDYRPEGGLWPSAIDFQAGGDTGEYFRISEVPRIIAQAPDESFLSFRLEFLKVIIFRKWNRIV
jgi:hypothetical protein